MPYGLLGHGVQKGVHCRNVLLEYMHHYGLPAQRQPGGGSERDIICIFDVNCGFIFMIPGRIAVMSHG